MKRKLMAILMICAMLFTLVGCGSEKDKAKKELEELVGGEVITEYTTLSIDTLTKVSKNKAAAISLQDGKEYKVKAVIESIEEDHLVVSLCDEYFYSPFYTSDFCGYVYGISTEVLANLEQGQGITILGQIVDLVDTTTTAYGVSVNGIALVFDGGINTKETIEVELVGPDEYFGYEEEYAWDINNGGDLMPIFFYTDMDFEKYKTYIGQTVMIETEYINGYYTRARIIEK